MILSDIDAQSNRHIHIGCDEPIFVHNPSRSMNYQSGCYLRFNYFIFIVFPNNNAQMHTSIPWICTRVQVNATTHLVYATSELDHSCTDNNLNTEHVIKPLVLISYTDADAFFC